MHIGKITRARHVLRSNRFPDTGEFRHKMIRGRFTLDPSIEAGSGTIVTGVWWDIYDDIAHCSENGIGSP